MSTAIRTERGEPAARYPMPPFPRGWYAVCDSDELAADEVKPLHYLGRELVAVRDANGDARVFDAYCPHLGAHLGHGGRVENGTLHCPFHGWQFSAETGACTGIPYAKRIPPKAEIGALLSREINGLVLVHHDPDGKPPAWELDPIAELDDPTWVRCDRLEWTCRTHVHEVLENVFDTAHLRYVHGTPDVPAIEGTSEDVGKIEFEMVGQSDLGVKLWGLGVAQLFYRIEVPLFEFDTLTPIDDDHIEMRSRIYLRDLGSPEANEAVSEQVVAELNAQADADIRIFEHKRHVSDPLLCDGDGPIPTFRRWAQQFYE